MKNFCDIYNVMTNTNKTSVVNFRVRNDVREDFKVVAFMNGSSVSTLLNQYMVRCIHELKTQDIKEFEFRKQQIIEAEKIADKKEDFISVPDKGELNDDTGNAKDSKNAA